MKIRCPGKRRSGKCIGDHHNFSAARIVDHGCPGIPVECAVHAQHIVSGKTDHRAGGFVQIKCRSAQFQRTDAIRIKNTSGYGVQQETAVADGYRRPGAALHLKETARIGGCAGNIVARKNRTDQRKDRRRSARIKQERTIRILLETEKGQCDLRSRARIGAGVHRLHKRIGIAGDTDIGQRQCGVIRKGNGRTRDRTAGNGRAGEIRIKDRQPFHIGRFRAGNTQQRSAVPRDRHIRQIQCATRRQIQDHAGGITDSQITHRNIEIAGHPEQCAVEVTDLRVIQFHIKR